VVKELRETFAGLQGVELGGQVIKRIIVDLLADFPRMNQFASLSPVPGFRDWLLDEISTYVRLRGQCTISQRPVERGEGNGVSYPGLRDVWGPPPSLRNIKYTRMRRFKKKNLKISPQRGPARMFPRVLLWLSTGLSPIRHIRIIITLKF